MKPDDLNAQRAPEDRPLRVLVIAGSNRRQYYCPGVDSKARTLMFRMADRLPAGVGDRSRGPRQRLEPRADPELQRLRLDLAWRSASGPATATRRTAGGQPDLMWNLDLYARLDLADAWAIIGPVNWYGPSSNLKAMFDRLVCMNGGNPREDLIEHKDPELAIALERSPEWEELSQNHLEGRSRGVLLLRRRRRRRAGRGGPARRFSAPGVVRSGGRAVRGHARRVRAAGLAVPLQRHRGARRAVELRGVRRGTRTTARPRPSTC